jgi:single stranded DNA-binding protein
MEAAFTGRLGQPPQQRISANGRRWTSFSLAVGSGEEAEWVKVAVFEPLTDELPSDLEKGEKLYVEGKLKLSRWEDAKGPRSGLQVAASRVIVLDRIGRRRKPARHKPDEKCKAAEEAATKSLQESTPRRAKCSLPDDSIPF